MANERPKDIGELIDRIDLIREDLLAIQRSMERLESLPKSGGENDDKKNKT